MDGKKSRFLCKQFMPFTNIGRNRPNDALKAVESGEQNFYLKMSDFPSSTSHHPLSSATMKFLYL